MIGNDDKLARLTSVKTETEAGVIVGGLEARGIPAVMSGIHTTNFRCEAPGWVEILVAEHDVPAARAVLDEVRGEHGDVDWSQVDVGEPEPDATSDAIPRWMGLRVWHRIAVAMIAIYLVWVGCVLFGGVLGLFWREATG